MIRKRFLDCEAETELGHLEEVKTHSSPPQTKMRSLAGGMFAPSVKNPFATNDEWGSSLGANLQPGPNDARA